MYNRAKIWTAVTLTAFFLSLLLVSAALSSFPAGMQVTDQPFERPGFAVDGKALYLGSSHRGSDLLSDLVSGTWFGLWICGLSSLVSLALSWPLWRVVKSRSAPVRLTGAVFIRTVCALSILPMVMLLSVTGHYYEHAPAPLIVLLTLFAFPFGVYFFATQRKPEQSFSQMKTSLAVYTLRRWAALHMLFAALGFVFWLRSEWPGSLIGIARSHATLIAFGDWTPAIPVAIHIVIALCIRLWAEVLEDRWSIPPSPLSDCWIFLPTFVENELDQRRLSEAAPTLKSP